MHQNGKIILINDAVEAAPHKHVELDRELRNNAA